MSDISEFLRKCAMDAIRIRKYVDDSIGDDHDNALGDLEELYNCLMAKAAEIESQEAS
jgi:hypothetical protein